MRLRQFFSSQLALGRTPYLVPIMLCYGMAEAMDRIDREFLQAELGRPRPAWNALGPLLNDSWAGYWGFVLGFGAVSAAALWLVGGWWYHVRLRWASAAKRLARLLYAYASFVLAGPVVAEVLIDTATYANYAEAWEAGGWEDLLMLGFPFWSIVTSYIGATSTFEVVRWKARLWFLVLPAVVYALVFGFVVVIAALAGA